MIQTRNAHSVMGVRKPHNFLVKENKHLQLADFGSAAPLMQREDGSTHFPPQYSACVVGTIVRILFTPARTK